MARPTPPRWTHFVALRLAHCPAASAAARGIQEKVVEHCPAARRALTAPEKLHITLAVVRAQDDGQATEMARIVDELGAPELEPLWLAELECFGAGRVFFLQPRGPHDRLRALAETVRAALAQAGFAVDPQPFVPHATISKLSKLPRKCKLRREIGDFFRALAGAEVSHPSADAGLVARGAALREDLMRKDAAWRPSRATRPWGLELCSMCDPPGCDGFYAVHPAPQPSTDASLDAATSSSSCAGETVNASAPVAPSTLPAEGGQTPGPHHSNDS